MVKPLWNLMYLLRKTPWDTGVTPPELVEVIEELHIPAGNALDIGCGTGTNAIYLCQHGFNTIGIDTAFLAIMQARYKARQNGVSVKFYTGDALKLGISKLPELNSSIDFVLDIGCFHSLAADQNKAYADMLRRVLRHGGYYLLYAWGKREWQGRLIGLEPQDVNNAIGSDFQEIWTRQGEERGLPSYWHLKRRL